VPPYSPDRRTAVVLCGTGAHGAYHAGVLKALQEAGVRIDVMAGQGVGAAGATIAALDGISRLADPDGIWRNPKAASFYQWTRGARMSAAYLATAVVAPAFTLLMLALELAPWAVPEWSRAGLLTAVVPIGLAMLMAWWIGRGARRSASGTWTWTLFGAPVDAEPARGLVADAIWNGIKGAAPVERPATTVLGRRFCEVLQENLGQPGFREMVTVATDLDARRDVVAALLREPYRQEFLAPRPGRDRRTEVFDLAGVGRDHAVDIVSAALTPPALCEPYAMTFAADGFWRGETHRTCDRPGTSARLLEEVAAAGVTQIIVVTAVAAADAPHRLRTPRTDVRSRLGEFQTAAEAAALRDALEVARLRFDAVYIVSPAHNAVGPFDLDGAYDEASDRQQSLPELIERGYEDAYRQFIEPVVGASGEQLAREQVEEVENWKT
jgi:hypothetical protein